MRSEKLKQDARRRQQRRREGLRRIDYTPSPEAAAVIDSVISESRMTTSAAIDSLVTGHAIDVQNASACTADDAFSRRRENAAT